MVLKKMKEMGLVFKAPTKRTTAGAVNKQLWSTEEDEELQSLYDEHRLEDGKYLVKTFPKNMIYAVKI